jgi:hypothetical protein
MLPDEDDNTRPERRALHASFDLRRTRTAIGHERTGISSKNSVSECPVLKLLQSFELNYSDLYGCSLVRLVPNIQTNYFKYGGKYATIFR